MAATIGGLKSQLDDMKAAAKAYGDVVPEDKHQISILDTPAIWGGFKNEPLTTNVKLDMGKVKSAGVDAIAKLAGSMRSIVAGANSLVDITSLNAPFTSGNNGSRMPSDAFGKAIAAGITEVVARNKRSSPHTVIRMAFGIYPLDDTFPAFIDFMSTFWVELWGKVKEKDRGVELYLAQFSTVGGNSASQGLKIAYEGFVTGAGSIWNHSKIIAADASIALVGGHNMVEADYGGEFAPCHDLSLLHRGLGVAHAHKFCNYLWDQGDNIVVRYAFDDETKKFKALKTKPFRQKYAQKLDNAFSRACNLAPVRLGYEKPLKEVVINIDDDEIDEKEDDNDEVVIQIEKSPVDIIMSDAPAKLDLSKEQWVDASVMGVGRTGGWLQGAGNRLTGSMGKVSAQNPSDVAKQYVIDRAVKNLFICQQDLAFRCGAQETNHWPMISILNRLSDSWKSVKQNSKTALRVRVVVTPFAGAAKDQYSWGSGAVDTWALFYSLAMGWFGGSAKTSIFNLWTKSSINQYILDRLCVAPLCFMDWQFQQELDYNKPENSPDASKYYFWPMSGTLPVYTLSNLAPAPVKTKAKYRRAPAHHAKTYLADNDIFYVGSDNWYPHTLAEYGYIVSGPDAVKEYKKKYAENVWQYSGPHCVNPRHDPTDDLHTKPFGAKNWFHPKG